MVEQKISMTAKRCDSDHQKKVPLNELLLNSPLRGENIDLSRDKDPGKSAMQLETN